MDIVFISYQETNAEENWQQLVSRFSQAKRVHGVKGVAQAHHAASELSRSEFFFVVDGDNKIQPDFHFEPPASKLRSDTLYVWRCLNPANDLVYGFGAVKLYNKTLIQNRYTPAIVDLATTISENYSIVPVVASQTHFFSSPREAWRGAFRECAKLASGQIHRQKQKETEIRLHQWCEKINPVPNADYVLKGARQGMSYGLSGQSMLAVNDFDWLNRQFDQQTL